MNARAPAPSFVARRLVALAFAILLGLPASARAAATDDMARELAERVARPITADSLPADFAPIARFVRREMGGQVMFSDGGIADGHVRHAQASFDLRAPAPGAAAKTPAFFIALELVDEPDFTFDGIAAALERRLGPPDESSGRAGALFRTWHLKALPGRTVTIAPSQASDNGDAVTIVQIVQDR
jgi:hypothetical protein